MTNKELAKTLRETPSRSKRKLLDEAADMIDILAEIVQSCYGCEACKHYIGWACRAERKGKGSEKTYPHGKDCNDWECEL